MLLNFPFLITSYYVKNLFATATWSPEFVHCSDIYTHVNTNDLTHLRTCVFEQYGDI